MPHGRRSHGSVASRTREKTAGSSASRSGNELFAVVVEDADGLDGADAGGELRVELGVLGDLADEDAVVGLLAVDEVGLAVVDVLLEALPLVDTLEHADAGVAVVLDSHAPSYRRAVQSPADAGTWVGDRTDPMA